MPTPEEIKSIALEYARLHRISESEAYYENKRSIEADDVVPILQWLSERYCLVEKSKVKELITKNRYYHDYNSLSQTFPEDLIPERTDWESMRSYADGLYYLVEDIMSLFEEEK